MASLPSALRTTTATTCSHGWRGLTPFRRRRARHVTRKARSDLRLDALTAALGSALQCPGYGLELCARIASAANISYPGVLHASIIQLVALRAQDVQAIDVNLDPRCSYMQFLPLRQSTPPAEFGAGKELIDRHANSGRTADIAIEALIRLSTATRTTPAAVVTVADICARDGIVERRGTRAASILRYVQYNRTLSTYVVFKAIFEAFVEALDFQSAMAMLNYTHATFTHVPAGDRAHWYDRLMYAALVRRELDVVTAAEMTKKQLGLPSESIYARGLAIAVDAERGEFDQAKERMQKLMKVKVRKKGRVKNPGGEKAVHEDGKIEPFVYAYLIKAAGRQNNVEEAFEFYDMFEMSIDRSPAKLRQSLALPTCVTQPRERAATNTQSKSQAKPKSTKRIQKPANQNLSTPDFSLRTADEAATDPTYALFLALRLCGEAQRAVQTVERLHAEYGVTFSPFLYSVVSETCFKVRRLDLGVRLRKLVQEQYGTKTTVSRKRRSSKPRQSKAEVEK